MDNVVVVGGETEVQVAISMCCTQRAHRPVWHLLGRLRVRARVQQGRYRQEVRAHCTGGGGGGRGKLVLGGGRLGAHITDWCCVLDAALLLMNAAGSMWHFVGECSHAPNWDPLRSLRDHARCSAWVEDEASDWAGRRGEGARGSERRRTDARSCKTVLPSRS